MDTNNDFFFKRIVNTPKRSIGDKTVEKIEEYSIDNNISMFDAIDKIDLPTRTLNNLKEFKEVILSIKDEIKHLDNRSEEHTSEFQSRPHLVCRLLLEKKKK